MSRTTRTACLPFVVVFVFFGLGVVPMLTWAFFSAWNGPSQLGDGSDPETYGFDLSNLTIDRATLQGSGNPRGFLETYWRPTTAAGTDVAAANAARSRSWQKEVVSDDRVIGVEINGEYRAYPLFILNAHEIVWDILGDEEIIVTYSPLLDAVCVYEASIAFNSEMFWVSGLLNNLNLVMYGGDPPTLFRQFSGEAIAGPSVGEQLKRIPGVSIDRWRTWLAAHPTTTVLLRDKDSFGRYKRISYDRYFSNDSWIIKPVGELPEGAKDRVLGVRASDAWTVLDLKALKAKADERGMVEEEIDGRTLKVRFDLSDSRVETFHVVEANGLELLPSLRVAWSLLNH